MKSGAYLAEERRGNNLHWDLHLSVASLVFLQLGTVIRASSPSHEAQIRLISSSSHEYGNTSLRNIHLHTQYYCVDASPPKASLAYTAEREQASLSTLSRSLSQL